MPEWNWIDLSVSSEKTVVNLGWRSGFGLLFPEAQRKQERLRRFLRIRFSGCGWPQELSLHR